MSDLPMADQKMLLILWNSFYQVFEVVMREKTTRPIFMQLAAVQHAQKTTLWKFFTRRTMQSTIRLFVLDFS
jgi:hypothetical protein